MMKRLFDLRFVIGMFFLVVGILLISYSFITSSLATTSINRWCGCVFVVFSIFMLVLSFRSDEPK